MGELIVEGVDPASCWDAFEKQFWNYWGRFSAAASNRGVVAIAPTLRFDSKSLTYQVDLGGAAISSHVPMETTKEVKDLFDSCYKAGVLLGNPPRALLLGHQRLKAHRQDDGTFSLRTAWYKYCLLFENLDPTHVEPSQWSAIRLESDSRVGWNSWLLNHPIHHFHFGLREELRIQSVQGRSLLSFIDLGVRSFAQEVWAEMYPTLYLHLTDSTGNFRFLTHQRGRAPDQEIQSSDADMVAQVLREARANGDLLHKELKQWQEDMSPWSLCVPEIFDVFMKPA